MTHNSLYTDDSYKFNASLKIIRNIINQEYERSFLPKEENTIILSIKDKLKKKQATEVHYPLDVEPSEQVSSLLDSVS